MESRADLSPAALVEDLRLAVTYAARAGLALSPEVSQILEAAESALRNGQSVETHRVTVAINQLARIIAPVTISDLKFGRDPFDPREQRYTKVQQVTLTVLALLMLIYIGWFMHALQREQEVVNEMTELQHTQPDVKLDVLRSEAEFETPLSHSGVLYDQYHDQEVALKETYRELSNANLSAAGMISLPLIPTPWGMVLSLRRAGELPGQSGAYGSGSYGSGASDPLPGSPAAGNAVAADPPTAALTAVRAKNASEGNARALATAVGAQVVSGDKENGSEMLGGVGFCSEDSGGSLRLPADASTYPDWMKSLLRDSLGNFCFQYTMFNSAGAGGQSAGYSSLSAQESAIAQYLPKLRDMVSVWRIWFLPFLFGMLGSTVFLIRAVEDVRTPVIYFPSILMRICFGGIAGIVIGWFTVPTGGVIETTSTLSFPLSVAFLVGYGIDALFRVLDRLTLAAGSLRAR